MEMVLDVSGSIFRQAEWEKSYMKTYTRVFEKLIELEYSEHPEVLRVLGNVGG
ncbi:MAG: hypothetical protein HYT70_02295 [Candidatus Aenigmarchaeota archaeon]|nr:hypothetical protein [Candidatus Aenigmarchaeota archaeon]